MTDKHENHSMAELKREVLIAYLGLRVSGISLKKRAELEQKYQDARIRLAKRISIEFP